MVKLYKRDVKKFISVFIKKLDINTYDYLRNVFENYLKENNIECVITSTERIVYAYGKNVEKYFNLEISDYLKNAIGDRHLEIMRSGNLEIVKNSYIKMLFYYKTLKSFCGIGCIILFFRKCNSKEAYYLLSNF